MRRLIVVLLLVAGFPAVLAGQATTAGGAAKEMPTVLALWSTNVEGDHVDFAKQALVQLQAMAAREHFALRTSTDWNELNTATPATTRMVVWLDDFPQTPAQRAAFEHYMEAGGGWLGFHIAAYNDRGTGWPWFLQFLGGGMFETNSWPPLPATLHVDAPAHAVAEGLPQEFVAPANEWYLWKPSPRENPAVKVLVTLSPSNYPLGFKDVITAGDLPVVWTNTRYRMLYMNMGHGDKIFSSPVQNRLIENSVRWVLRAPAAK